jgi:hypothetical protein
MLHNLSLEMALNEMNLERQTDFAFSYYYFTPCVTRLLHDGRTSM